MFYAFAQAQIPILEMTVGSKSLEQVFLELTGSQETKEEHLELTGSQETEEEHLEPAGSRETEEEKTVEQEDQAE